MKSFLNKFYLLGLILTLTMVSCDEGFEELNLNPTQANELDPKFQFSYVQLQTSGERYENWRAVLIYSSTMIQHLSALATYWSGDKYLYNSGYSSSLFDRAYNNYIKDIQDLINNLETSGENPEMLAMARIWRVVAFHRITDIYGDIPYSEAGKGYIDGITAPKYDAQEDIYKDMIAELESAIGQLTGGGRSFGSADFVYGGNTDQWRKFANSMLLRLGMRMSKADPAAAEAAVRKAISGGVMSSNADIAMIQHSSGPEGINQNGIGQVFLADDNQRMSKTFIDWMANHNDPRIDVLGYMAVGGAQVGLPNGYDAQTISDYGSDDLNTYSRVNPKLVTVDAPMIFMTYAEVELLLAEAALRGWHSGDAATHYNNGVKAAIQQWQVYDASLAISDADADAYLAANPFNAAEGMRMIGEQYWAATFLNEYEAFANWRRTGYPELTPTDYPGNESNSQIPRRLRYPDSEYGINGDNIQAAISRQGPDEFTTRVWWDK
jgi:hypothetical protein